VVGSDEAFWSPILMYVLHRHVTVCFVVCVDRHDLNNKHLCEIDELEHTLCTLIGVTQNIFADSDCVDMSAFQSMSE